MEKHRVEAWMNGFIPDGELTDAEVQWLEAAVFEAVGRKLNAHATPEELQ